MEESRLESVSAVIAGFFIVGSNKGELLSAYAARPFVTSEILRRGRTEELKCRGPGVEKLHRHPI